MNKRIASIYLPRLAIERLRRPDRSGATLPGNPPEGNDFIPPPFALVQAGTRGVRLFALALEAERLGLHPGMPLADALVLAPQLQTQPADPQADRRELRRLARWCLRYGLSGNSYDSDTLWIDISGSAHLFGGEQTLLRRIRKDFAALGYKVQAAIADNFAAAFALSRFHGYALANGKRGFVIPPGQAEDWLSSLPVEALRLDADITALLRRLGLRDIGQLLALPRAALQQRFSSDQEAEAVLLRLDQALGRREEPLVPLRPPPRFAVQQNCAEALLSPQQIEAVLPQLLQQLCEQLQTQNRGIRRLVLTLWRMDGSSARLQIGSSSPSRDQPHLLRLLGEKLARIEPGFGIDIVTLAASRTEGLKANQCDLSNTRKTGRTSASRLLDRLANRLQQHQIYGLQTTDRHQPEQAQQTCSPAKTTQTTAPFPGKTLSKAPVTPLAVSNKPVSPFALRNPRPLLLLQPPEAIRVMAPLPDEPPLSFTWRKVTRRVRDSDGPERISAEWGFELAGPASRPRDYYRVESEDGGLFWLYRDGLYSEDLTQMPRWFMHGLFT